MTNLEVLIYFKDKLICRFYEWEDIECGRGVITVYHSDGESVAFVGRQYAYKIIEVET